jgi:glutathione synthase/RimK-type ligase-like ATP-grasp enzyme
MPSILIMTTFDDVHAQAVYTALRRLQADVHYWVPCDMPDMAGATVRIGPAGLTDISVMHDGKSISISDCRVFWNRRLVSPVAPTSASEYDREVIEEETLSFISNIVMLIASNAVTINPPMDARRANRKAVQLVTAAACNLTIVPTMFSNNFEDVRDFFAAHNPIVAKLHRSQGWMCSDYSSVMSMTFELPEPTEADRWSLENCPLILQKKIVRKMEVRAVIFGNHVFAAKTVGAGGELDGRDELTESEFSDMAEVVLPQHVHDGCLDYMRCLSIKFGAFDFIVDEDDCWYFLECNEAGQWLYIEDHVPQMHMLEAFCHWLVELSGQVVPAEAPEIRFAEITSSNEFQMRESTSHKAIRMSKPVIQEVPVEQRFSLS